MPKEQAERKVLACDDDEVLYGGSCYRFIHDELKLRDDAHRDCIARNSHLVYIESQEEQTFLTNRSRRYGTDNTVASNHYWIGLIPTSSNVWLDGNPARNDLFEFSQDSAAGCFSLSKSSGNVSLHGENCNRDRYYVCERPYECPLGGFNHSGSCYWVGGSRQSHLSAQGGCSDDGGHLLYIESQDELQFINNNLAIEDNVRYWIGLTTQYAWLDGSRAIYQGFVQTNQYSNNQGSLCFRLRPLDDFLWNDIGCNTNYAYICERELPVTPHETQQNPGIPCRPPVAYLNRLLDSVPLCVRSDSHYFNNSVLCQCGDNETCISGCGCARDDTVDG
ncbi:C-type mannose receptor 2-like [Patiria miniata]|uniref:C-type lectin domain-containing protein n=1 Tax=Patiria miniata TaxID=46514 RepID=A0A914A4U1_PATMI|nr:C-type mannose receptor 2-like [Patiria miniata]